MRRIGFEHELRSEKTYTTWGATDVREPHHGFNDLHSHRGISNFWPHVITLDVERGCQYVKAKTVAAWYGVASQMEG